MMDWDLWPWIVADGAGPEALSLYRLERVALRLSAAFRGFGISVDRAQAAMRAFAEAWQRA